MNNSWLRNFFRYVPIFLILLLPILGLYGMYFPWSAAEPVLAKYPDYQSFLIGQRSEYRSSGEYEYTMTEKSYLLIGKNILESTVLKVKVDSDSGLEVKSSSLSALVVLANYLLLIVVCLFAWFGKRRQ